MKEFFKNHSKSINAGLWLTVISVVLIPGTALENGMGFIYGFPAPFLTKYNTFATPEQWFLFGDMAMNITGFIINSAIFALIIESIKLAIAKSKTYKKSKLHSNI